MPVTTCVVRLLRAFNCCVDHIAGFWVLFVLMGVALRIYFVDLLFEVCFGVHVLIVVLGFSFVGFGGLRSCVAVFELHLLVAVNVCGLFAGCMVALSA